MASKAASSKPSPSSQPPRPEQSPPAPAPSPSEKHAPRSRPHPAGYRAFLDWLRLCSLNLLAKEGGLALSDLTIPDIQGWAQMTAGDFGRAIREHLFKNGELRPRYEAIACELLEVSLVKSAPEYVGVVVIRLAAIELFAQTTVLRWKIAEEPPAGATQ